jgi:hypothetical protein
MIINLQKRAGNWFISPDGTRSSNVLHTDWDEVVANAYNVRIAAESAGGSVVHSTERNYTLAKRADGILILHEVEYKTWRPAEGYHGDVCIWCGYDHGKEARIHGWGCDQCGGS